ncbi:MAG: lipase family protein [Azospirillaceae bacterium]|nr:lipase family protein [Azospirillaceae bacterium]
MGALFRKRLMAAAAGLVLLSQGMAFADTVANPYSGDGGVSDFYRWNAPIPAPGRMLRWETLPADQALDGAARGDRILYSSTDGWLPDGAPATGTVVSGLVYLPKGAPPAGGWPVIAWAHGTTGTADVCAPSWQPKAESESQYLNRWLAQGYAIVASDYQGLGTAGPHPYMGLKAAAYGMLDAVRAARAAYPALSPKTIVVGQSQGAHAALGTGLLAPDYAPDVKLLGVVATGVPGEPDFAPTLPADLDQSTTIAKAAVIDPATPRGAVRGLALDRFDPWAVVYLNYFTSYATVDPAFKAADYLTPRGLELLRDVAGGCHSTALAAVFKERPPLSALFTRDPAPYEAKMAVRRRYPDPAFRMPVFIGIGLKDLYTAPELSFNVARAACLRGSTVAVRFYPGQDHSGAVLPSQADSLPFVQALFAGQAVAGNCDGLAWPGRS